MAKDKEQTAQNPPAANQNGGMEEIPSSSFFEKLKMLKPYWVSDEKKRARLLFVAIIGLTLAEVAFGYGIMKGTAFVIDAMIAKNLSSFSLGGIGTIGGMFGLNLAQNQRQYLTDTLTLNWRGWLTKQFNKEWLNDQAYFKLQQGNEQKQNPDQRIAENIPTVADQSLGLTLGFLRSFVTAIVFSMALWGYSPLMLAAAVGCAAVTTLTALKIGQPLQKIITALQSCEAKFRHALVRIKDNVKPIALADMASVEEKSLSEKFNDIDTERRSLYKSQRVLGIFTTFNGQCTTIIPIALAAPQFFKGLASAGDLSGMRDSYANVYTSLSWLTQGYQLFANWSTNANQLVNFSKAIEEAKRDMLERKSAPEKAPAPPAPAIQPAKRMP